MGSGAAIGFLLLQAVLFPVAWFFVSLWEVGRITWMQHRHGADLEFKPDPVETKYRMIGLMVGFNVVVFVFLR